MAEENVAEEIKETVVDTKQEAVVDLEKDSKKEEKVTVETNDTIQIDFAMIEKEAFLKEIAGIEIMTMTPLAAMNKLFEIVQKSKNM